MPLPVAGSLLLTRHEPPPRAPYKLSTITSACPLFYHLFLEHYESSWSSPEVYDRHGCRPAMHGASTGVSVTLIASTEFHGAPTHNVCAPKARAPRGRLRANSPRPTRFYSESRANPRQGCSVSVLVLLYDMRLLTVWCEGILTKPVIKHIRYVSRVMFSFKIFIFH